MTERQKSGLKAAILTTVFAIIAGPALAETVTLRFVQTNDIDRMEDRDGRGGFAKLAAVVLILGYHHACGLLLRRFVKGTQRRSHVWYRWFNEVPVILLVAVVVLVVVKPF